MDLLNEIKRRKNDDSDIYQALGAEIKQHRIKQSKTLSTMAQKNFSISYLCKIEKNQVKPSKKYLKEICDKINISDEKVSSLLSSRNILLDVVKCFYYKDILSQNDILFRCEGLDNHRVILIRFICSLTRLSIVECDEYIRKLWSLTSSLADLDLILFTTFYGVYKYYIGSYIEAMDYINTALTFNLNVDYLEPIQYGYLFMSAYKTYSRTTVDYYHKLENLQLRYGCSLKLEPAHYYMCLYYLSLKQFNNFDLALVKLDNNNLIYSLNVIKSLLLDSEINIEVDKLNPLAKAYYYVYIGSRLALDLIKTSSIATIEKLLLQYIYYRKNEITKSLDFILDEIIPYIIEHNISYIGYQLLEELLRSPLKISKYKRLCDIFSQLYNVSLEVDSL